MLLDVLTPIDVDGRSEAVRQAAADLRRDLGVVCGRGDVATAAATAATTMPATGTTPTGTTAMTTTGTSGTSVSSAAPVPSGMPSAAAPGTDVTARIELADDPTLGEGMYRVVADRDVLRVIAGDDFGFIYGLYHISRELLGVPDLWFWMDWTPAVAGRKPGPVAVPDGYAFASRPFAVADRGWFVNDEVLLMGWQLDNDPDQPWEMVFEALLRCGGTMVIPGTGNNSAHHAEAASRRGLRIAQHHAEPLGARLFSSAYPDLNPSWGEHKDLFIALWEESLEAHRGQHVIWNVGFRGQGDSAFWDSDPSYDTDEKRGALMGEIIRIQRRMVLDHDPQARTCVYLYGETLELYRKGVLDLPDDVIKIWSDNGYGRMVTRRQCNHNPRIDAMPNPADRGAQGIYYHASFYDLQAANHITTLPVRPERIVHELGEVLARGGDAFWIVNSSNVKPHAYYLSLIARLWRDGLSDIDVTDRRSSLIPAESDEDGAETESLTTVGTLLAGTSGDAATFVRSATRTFATEYYGERDAAAVADAYAGYFDAAVAYGDRWDERAGEQYFNHCPRMLVTQFMRDRNASCDDMRWAAGDVPLVEQIAVVDRIAARGAAQYAALDDRDTAAATGMSPHARRLFDDSIALHTRVYRHCCEATHLTCRALWEGFAEDWQHAFFHAGLARREFRRAREAMLAREHGVWHGYYANECLTDIAQSAWVLSGLMAYLRTMGDGPHFFQWQRDFIYSREEQKIKTLLNLENHLTDDEIFDAMLVKWEDAEA
ncbi:glycosyl hydrolase 115 family protein [Bifidobacterium amazonense]|uniref:Glycosyl hydrolase 115 family protein n=1 Tax=Bifidobacterium amazonense TaxID=2809027 RepID=A0ABS9VSZ0_9BIFI|nr:glycosyl hydrolase 115 family protein [Bifidobacterium amazonense]MCH9275193.1 glycosyl hydrolase 115 family protein [Bifidobacterium amazonense]